MKCTVWFDLPKALANLTQDIITEKEKQHVEYLISIAKTIQDEYDSLSSMFLNLTPSLNSSELAAVKDKLNSINKERIDLVCKNIKISIQMISKFLAYLETKKNPANEAGRIRLPPFASFHNEWPSLPFSIHSAAFPCWSKVP